MKTQYNFIFNSFYISLIVIYFKLINSNSTNLFFTENFIIYQQGSQSFPYNIILFEKIIQLKFQLDVAVYRKHVLFVVIEPLFLSKKMLRTFKLKNFNYTPL